jgi:hypothetical protein
VYEETRQEEGPSRCANGWQGAMTKAVVVESSMRCDVAEMMMMMKNEV